MVTGTPSASPKLDYRQARGAALAKSKARSFKQIAGDTYLVPSATAPGSGSGYVVDLAAGRCTCPDYEERHQPCKHQWALRYFRHELELPDGAVLVTEFLQAKRVTYPQNWPAYNAAQQEEGDVVPVLLRGLCDGIVEPKHPRGRKPVPLRDAVYSATMKVYSTKSSRLATSGIRACEQAGYIEHAPSYASVLRTIERSDLTSLFRVLVQEAALPLKAVERDIAVDATGFSTSTYIRWFDHKYGEEKKVQRWVKAHAAVGVHTNVVTAVDVTEANVADSLMFAGLVKETKANGFDVREVSADKAYLGHGNLAVVEEIGAVPYIPFKENSRSDGSAAWQRMWHCFSLQSEAFFSRYHKRSNVEATFSSVKRKLGGSVRATSPVAMVNEVLLKFLCHNLATLVHAIHELGIDPKFWMPKGADAQRRAADDAGEAVTRFRIEVGS